MEKLEKLLFEYNGTTELYYLDSLDFLHGFIKWLIENDKIDIKKIISEAEYFCEEYYNLKDNLNWTIMLLSIQDNLIEFLVSIIK